MLFHSCLLLLCFLTPSWHRHTGLGRGHHRVVHPFWIHPFVQCHQNRVLGLELSIKQTFHMAVGTWGQQTQQKIWNPHQTFAFSSNSCIGELHVHVLPTSNGRNSFTSSLYLFRISMYFKRLCVISCGRIDWSRIQNSLPWCKVFPFGRPKTEDLFFSGYELDTTEAHFHIIDTNDKFMQIWGLLHQIVS